MTYLAAERLRAESKAYKNPRPLKIAAAWVDEPETAPDDMQVVARRLQAVTDQTPPGTTWNDRKRLVTAAVRYLHISAGNTGKEL